MMKHREKGFISTELPTVDGKECSVGYEYICGWIFHTSHACLGGKPEEYRKVIAPALGLLKYGAA